MNVEAQLQIRRLYNHSSPAERQKIKKYLKPLPTVKMPTKKCTEPQHIREILPDVMLNIQQRMENSRMIL